MASITIAILAGTLILCWFINSTFLEGYYERNKESGKEKQNPKALTSRFCLFLTRTIL